VVLCEAIRLSRRFGGIMALQDVTLRIQPGTIVAIIGPNGSGKTTLFNLLAGQLRPTAGRVIWRGQEITAWPPHRRCRAGINRTFQVAQPFPDLTLSENVALGLLYAGTARGARRRDVEEQAREVLSQLGLAAKAGVIARTLSLGDLKRLELAMAVATRPALLLVDEVLAGQSPASAQEILDYLVRLRDQGVAICLVEHRLKALLAVADRMVALHQGGSSSRGTRRR
jgi:branched-chain amino acid transport system ATP-binding protein